GACLIVGVATERIVRHAVAIGDDYRIAFFVGDDRLADHARTDAPDVETAQLRLTQEEAIRQAHVLPQALDVSALSRNREDEVAPKVPVFGGIRPGAEIAHLTTE